MKFPFILKSIYQERWKKLSLLTFSEFVFTSVGDIVQPKFNAVLLLFFTFLILTIFCYYRIYEWANVNNRLTIMDRNYIFDKKIGISRTITEATPIVNIGFIITSLFLIFQFSTEGGNGLLTSIIPALKPIQSTLLGIDNRLASIDEKLDNVKKETSQDARKELANIGISWEAKNFLDAVKVGDEKIVSLFLQGGLRPETAESEGSSIAVKLSLNYFNPEKILSLLLKAGLNINETYPKYSPFGNMKMTLLGTSIELKNIKLVKSLIDNNVDLSKPMLIYETKKLPIDSYPLSYAICRNQPEIAFLLLDADVDISVGDYAAYREAYKFKRSSFWQEHSTEIIQILQKTLPPSKIAQRINIELRLEDISVELNQIGLKSIQLIGIPAEKERYDQLYDALQTEKAVLTDSLTKLK